MEDLTKRLSRPFFVSANEANAQQELAAHILVTNIIDVATEHANRLHIGNPDMEELNGGWVLSRLTVEMERWPEVNTKYWLETWVETYNRYFSERSFRIYNREGETLGYARTVWMIIDTSTHTNLGLSHLPLSEALIDGEVAPIERQKRQCPVVTGEEAQTRESRKPCLTATLPPVKYRFKYCDIDFYRHVNTVRYVMLLQNQYSLEDMDANRLKRMELMFMREAHYGMTVDIMQCRPADSRTATFTLCEEDNHETPLLFARMTLTPRQ